ncbi:hypothetical protein DRN52_05185, partial [Thermococci archaeon]
NTSEDFSTIQDAINDPDTQNGHVIVIDPGRYEENVNVTKELTITSVAGAEIIAENSEDYVFKILANNVTISNLTISGANKWSGIFCKAGIYAYKVNNTKILNNSINNNSCGIYLYYSNNSIIENNRLLDNDYGIYLHDFALGNLIKDNEIKLSDDGIHFEYHSNENIVQSNIIVKNDCGIHTYQSSNNLIYNNYFNNTINAQEVRSHNKWNLSGIAVQINLTTGEIIPNVAGGPYFGGNYWSDYQGEDTNGDGIGDTLIPHTCNNKIIGDWLPLTKSALLTQTSTGEQAKFVTDSGEFEDLEAVDEDSLPQEAKDNKPEGLNLPYGLFNFTISGLTPGESVIITITLPSDIPVGSLWWKVNLTDNSWYSIPIGDDDGDNVITITLADGGLGDNDGIANGVIVDPGGLGHMAKINISDCTVISKPGYYVLNRSIIDSSKTCIRIISSNVVLDGNGYVIDGKDYVRTYGVYVYNESKRLENVIVKNITVTDWDYAIWYRDVSRGYIVNCNASSNLFSGIKLTSSDYSRIEKNTVTENIPGIFFVSGGIELYNSSNNIITGNILVNNKFGIFLRSFSKNNVITNNSARNNSVGIQFHESSEFNIIRNNNLTENWAGISSAYPPSNNNIFVSNVVSRNKYGFDFHRVSNDTLINNTVVNNSYGVYLEYSCNNKIANNIIKDNLWGIELAYHSEYNNVTTNTIINNSLYGIYVVSDKSYIINNKLELNGIFVDSYYNRVLNNTVNGKPLVYLENVRDFIVRDAGQVILVKCDNVTVSSLNLSRTSVGVELFRTSNSVIANITAANNVYGIYMRSSDNNLVIDNKLHDNDVGIHIIGSDNNNILDNEIYDNNKGIHFPTGVASSKKNNLDNNTINNNTYGLYLGDGYRTNVVRNTIHSNIYGIYLYFSGYCNITENIISSNIEYGMYVNHSNNNIIYLNDFISNTDNVESYESTNVWNSTEKIVYTYKGSEFENYMGNYWDDYTGSDSNGDGIGDSSYQIDRDEDYYPLMESFKKYIEQVEKLPPIANFTYSPQNPFVDQKITFNASLSYDPDGSIVSYTWDFGDGNVTNTTEEKIKHSYSESGSYKVTLTVKDDEGATNSTTKMITIYSPTAIFDTGSSRNPYPSIMGTHKGTITPNKTI